MIFEVLKYVQSCSRKAKEVQSLKTLASEQALWSGKDERKGKSQKKKRKMHWGFVALRMGFVKIGLGTGLWAKFGLGNGIWSPHPLQDPLAQQLLKKNCWTE